MDEEAEGNDRPNEAARLRESNPGRPLTSGYLGLTKCDYSQYSLEGGSFTTKLKALFQRLRLRLTLVFALVQLVSR